MQDDDEKPRAAPLARLQAEDLAPLPIDELEDRRTRLRAEIARVDRAIEDKHSTRSAAENFFRK